MVIQEFGSYSGKLHIAKLHLFFKMTPSLLQSVFCNLPHAHSKKKWVPGPVFVFGWWHEFVLCGRCAIGQNLLFCIIFAVGWHFASEQSPHLVNFHFDFRPISPITVDDSQRKTDFRCVRHGEKGGAIIPEALCWPQTL